MSYEDLQTLKETINALRHDPPKFDVRSFRRAGFTGGDRPYHWAGGNKCRALRNARNLRLRKSKSYSRIVAVLELETYDFGGLSEGAACKACMIQFTASKRGSGVVFLADL